MRVGQHMVVHILFDSVFIGFDHERMYTWCVIREPNQ